mmetsp:Transcript_4166/g.9328  ORF Transcript_4166/g.9328 Transcript_4166/m.9328 type:complete len:202 (-) Transcript_4166:1093-1698(-)
MPQLRQIHVIVKKAHSVVLFEGIEKALVFLVRGDKEQFLGHEMADILEHIGGWDLDLFVLKFPPSDVEGGVCTALCAQRIYDQRGFAENDVYIVHIVAHESFVVSVHSGVLEVQEGVEVLQDAVTLSRQRYEVDRPLVMHRLVIVPRLPPRPELLQPPPIHPRHICRQESHINPRRGGNYHENFHSFPQRTLRNVPEVPPH